MNMKFDKEEEYEEEIVKEPTPQKTRSCFDSQLFDKMLEIVKCNNEGINMIVNYHGETRKGVVQDLISNSIKNFIPIFLGVCGGFALAMFAFQFTSGDIIQNIIWFVGGGIVGYFGVEFVKSYFPKRQRREDEY